MPMRMNISSSFQGSFMVLGRRIHSVIYARPIRRGMIWMGVKYTSRFLVSTKQLPQTNMVMMAKIWPINFDFSMGNAS